MNASISPAHRQSFNLTDILTLVLIILAIAVIAGVQLPLLSTPRSALVALFITGIVLCAGGIGRISTANSWFHPIAILGYLVGVSILIVAMTTFVNKPLPFIANDQGAFTLITALIGIKWALTQVFWLTHK